MTSDHKPRVVWCPVTKRGRILCVCLSLEIAKTDGPFFEGFDHIETRLLTPDPCEVRHDR